MGRQRDFYVIPGYSQDLLLALCSGLIPGSIQETNAMPEIGQAKPLESNILLWAPFQIILMVKMFSLSCFIYTSIVDYLLFPFHINLEHWFSSLLGLPTYLTVVPQLFGFGALIWTAVVSLGVGTALQRCLWHTHQCVRKGLQILASKLTLLYYPVCYNFSVCFDKGIFWSNFLQLLRQLLVCFSQERKIVLHYSYLIFSVFGIL